MKKKEFDSDVARILGGETLINIKHLDVLPLETKLNVEVAIENAGEVYQRPEFIGFNNVNSEISLHSIAPDLKNGKEIWVSQRIAGQWTDTEINSFGEDYDSLPISKDFTKKIQNKLGLSEDSISDFIKNKGVKSEQQKEVKLSKKNRNINPS